MSSEIQWAGKKGLTSNALAAVAQVLSAGLVFFLLYRFILDNLGVEQLGIWSLVLAATSVSRVGELGLSGGVVRFVARALGRNDAKYAGEMIQTVTLSLAVIMSVIVVLIYPMATWILGKLLSENELIIAVSVLPMSLFSLWSMVVARTLLGGLDGCQRIDLRSLATVLANVSYLVLAYFWMQSDGLWGVARAQAVQAFGLGFLAWFLLRRQLRGLPIVPMTWRRSLFADIFMYGVNFQAISIMTMLFDPVVKALMSHFGGIASVGFYEMANKLIIQGRAIIVEANRVIVPAVAYIPDQETDRLGSLYRKSYRMMFFFAAGFFALLISSLQVISLLWIGKVELLFILFGTVLCAGWFANTLIVPAFFINLGTGELRGNVVSHIIISVSSFLSAVLLGGNYGAMGVCIGAAIGLLCGSIYLQWSFVRGRPDVNWADIFPSDLRMFFAVCLIATTINLVAFQAQYSLSEWPLWAASCSVILAFGWLHPMRSSVTMAFLKKGRK